MSTKAKYYRNTGTIYYNDMDSVDAQSLWERKGDILILVDDDRYLEHDITMNFVEVKC